ncbi:MAG TPA: hypothetical protein VHC43_16695 [Mycobacteriales bacterium]|nr:hypothetical protein [Mycobacteriales bacterium]
MRMRRLTATLPLVLGAACGSASSGAGTAAQNPLSGLSCPSPQTAPARFPTGPAADVPHPAYAQSPKPLPVDVKGETEVQFTTAVPLSIAAAFVQSAYRAAGYRIVGGDAEAHEADILWAHGNAHGKTRLSGAGCTTTWTVLALPAGTDIKDNDR